MFYVFVLSLLFTTSAFADFQNELPSNFPAPSNTESSRKSDSKQNLKKDKSSGPQKKAGSNTQSNTNQTEAPKETSTNNQGAFSSELGNHDNDAPVFFTGKHGDGSRTTGIFNLVGDAVIIQDDTTLKSNKAQLFSLPGNMPTPGTSRIQKAVATGNVRIFKKATATAPEIKATGEQTEFLVPQRILILKGKAKVWRTNEYLNGDTIKISLNTGDIDIIRPEGTFDPKSANTTFGEKSHAQDENKSSQDVKAQ